MTDKPNYYIDGQKIYFNRKVEMIRFSPKGKPVEVGPFPLCRVYSHISPQHIAKQLNQRDELAAICEDFIAKVESGRAHSVDTYNKMLVALGKK